MQQIHEVQVGMISQAAPAAAAKAAAGSRLAYVDGIRFVLIVLVIAVHAAITYGAVGDWTYHDPTANDSLSDVLLSLLVMYSQSFFMALFFFFAGYFTPGSYDRKGLKRFWKDRLLHIAVPMLLYTLVLSRLPNYLDDVQNEGVTANFWQFSLSTFWNDADGGPAWFLLALLGFTLVYTLWRLISRRMPVERTAWIQRVNPPTTRTLLVIVPALAVIMFAIAQFQAIPQALEVFGTFNFLLAFFPGYILFFAAGILAYRNDWLTRLPDTMLRLWGWLSVGLIVALPVFLIGTGAMESDLGVYMAGSDWRCAGMALFIQTMLIAFSITLTLLLRRGVRAGSRLAAFVSPNTFAVYLIHPLVLVPITAWMSQFADLHPLIKFSVATAVTVALCYALAEGLRRVPGLKAIL